MEPYVDSNNILVYPLYKGLEFTLTVESETLLFSFDEIVAEIKTEARLKAPEKFRLTLGEGITTTGTTLTITLTEEQTATIKNKPALYMDVKGRDTGGNIQLLMEVKLMIFETITEMDNG